MTGQPILSDATLEAMLARRAGAGVPSGLAEAIDSALGRLPERRSWQSFLAPPARWTSAMGLVWVLAMLALLMAVSLSAFLVASDLLRRADEPTVVPPPTVQPAPSTTPPSVSPSAGPPAAATRPIDQFNSLAFAADGSVWLATTGGLIHWDLHTPTATLYGQNEGLPTTAALNVKVAPDGTVWAVGGTSFRVWFAQYDGRWTVYSTPADLGGVEIIDFGGMAVGADGRVWSAVSSSVGPNGLLRFDGTWTAIDVPESVGVNASPWGFGLTVAPDGTLWAGTPFSGLAAFDGTTWTSYSAATTGLPRTPWLAGVAPDGSVWVGLPGEGCTVSTGCAVPAAGVARFDGTSWSVYTTADGLADDDANVFVGPGRDVWITYATLPDTVSRFDGGRWNTMQVAGLAGATALAVAPDGALWLHATDGLLRYDGSALTRYQLPAVEVPPELPPLELPLISGPTETRSGLGTIVWRTYRSPSEYYLRASSTPHGPVAIDGPDLRWLIAAGSWAGTTLPIAPWRATAAGDDVIVTSQAAVRLAWDGSRWVPGDALDLPGSLGFIYRVASGSHGTVLAGSSSVAWATDGQHFVDAVRGPVGPTPDASDPNAPNSVSIGPVFATDDGFVALVPRQAVVWGGPFLEPVPWFSADGSTWEPVGSESPFGPGASVSDVAGRDGRYVAVGTSGAVWVSDDGLSWTGLPALESRESCEPSFCSGDLVEVEAAEFGWMVLSRDGMALTSTDGRTWEPLLDWPRVRGGWATPTLALGRGTIVVTGNAVDRAPGATMPTAVIVVGTIEP